MAQGERFFDSNVLLYLLSGDAAKAGRAEDEIAAGGVVSVQVLNEFASVAIRKFGMKVDEVRDALLPVRAVCRVVPVDESIHDLGLQIAARHRLSVYDAMICAAAIGAGCTELLSEDMQHGQLIGQTLRIRNPFRD